MVSHWWKTLTGGPTKAASVRRSVPRLESLEDRRVPSVTPVTAGATTAPALTSAQELRIDRAFADRLENRLDHAQADVKHDAKEIEADKDRIAWLEKRVDKTQADIAKDAKANRPADLAADSKRLAKLDTALGRAKEDLTGDQDDLADDKLHVAAVKKDLNDVRALIALDLAGATHDANYKAKVGVVQTDLAAEEQHVTTDIGKDTTREGTLKTRLAEVNADILTDTGEQLATDTLIAGRIETRLGRLEMDVTHDAAALKAEQDYSATLDARLLVVTPSISGSVMTH